MNRPKNYVRYIVRKAAIKKYLENLRMSVTDRLLKKT